jgi:hypothetical protein
MQGRQFQIQGTPVRYELVVEWVGGHAVHVASLAADPGVRCIAPGPEQAIARLQARLEAAATAPAPTWSRQAPSRGAAWA